MINKLVERIMDLEAPIVVGLDPMLSYVPEHILSEAYKNKGETSKVFLKLYGCIIKELLMRSMILYLQLSRRLPCMSNLA